ncbi:MAG: CHAD domain-containing protein [Pelomonas sp.]|nr:CHAD domain-containing protein [Roseateles sp.]
METELKFVFEAATLPALERRLARGERTRLRACYFDAVDDRLAHAGVALRLRLEGDQWVQTLKARGAGPVTRLEHECPRGTGAAMPALDLALHAGTPAGAALAAVLDGAALVPVYETDVWRTHLRVRSGGGAVELALDVGELRAGDAREAIREIEFELLDGPLDALLVLAAQWTLRHGLWLDLRSKAERGQRLARNVGRVAATKAAPPQLAKTASAEATLRAMVGACLAQILPNATELTAGLGTAAHLHQLRVGLRRLRSALRLLGDRCPEAPARWEQPLRTLFAATGARRNLDVLEGELLPALRAAGAPELVVNGSAAADAGADAAVVLRRPGVGLLWLELLAFAQGAPAGGAADGGGAALAEARLAKLERRLRKEAARFASFGDAECHALRKRLKRLRYGLELAAPLLPKKRRHVLPALRPLLDLLGQYNDACQAQAYIAAHAADPGRAFALGWLAARREALRGAAERALAAWLGRER